MWRCSNCGEAIPDNFDVCWHCGVHRDGALSLEFHAEPDDPTVPDPKSELPAPGQTAGDEAAPRARPEWAWTPGNLAALLLRLLGLYLAATGSVGVVGYVGHIMVLSRMHGLDQTFATFYPIEYLCGPSFELILGIYFLVGGQWVYDKILAPMSRSLRGAAASARLRASEKGESEWICSECQKPLPERGETFQYCPYCGASVAEEVDDEGSPTREADSDADRPRD